MYRQPATRRNLIKATALGVAGAVSFPCIVPASSLGGDGELVSSDRINLGLIGTGNINGHHREAFLAEISARLDRRLKWDAQAERLTDDDTANRLLARSMRSPWHL